MPKAQGSLEYIIIIGGIIIIAAATYFMLKGFSQSTGAGTTDQIGVAGDKLRLELENLGRSEAPFFPKKWGSYPCMSELTLDSPTQTDTALTLNNLTDYGLDTDNLEFAYNSSGNMQFLSYTHSSPVTVTLPNLPAGTTALLIFHDNISALKLDNLNHTSPDSVTVTDGSTAFPSPETAPPSILIPPTAFASGGSLESVEIKITVSGTNSSVSEIYYSVESSPWLPADNYYYEYGGITYVGYPSDGSYDSESETVSILVSVPSLGNYTISILARDEYGNENTSEQEVEVLYSGWTADMWLSTASSGVFQHPGVGVSGNSAHVLWTEDKDGNREIYYKNSSDGGITWGPDFRFTNYTAISDHPYLVVSGSSLHVFWKDIRDANAEVYYKNSSDGGITWGNDTRLTNDLGSTNYPVAAVSGSDLHVVWHDGRDGDLEAYYKNSSDGGINWSDDFRLTNDPSRSLRPSIAASGSNLHVAWGDNRSGNYQVYYKNSSDAGITWSGDEMLTVDPSCSWRPSIAVSTNNVHVVWQDNRSGNNETYYKNSSDGGINWGPDYRLTNDPADSIRPFFAISGDNLHVVWTDNRTGKKDVYYKNSSDGGITWSSDLLLSKDDSADSYFPSIAPSGDDLHVVWYDNRSGSWELYYKRYYPG